jgi:hypothetical protein
VISRRLWVRRFAGDSAIIGRPGAASFNGVATTVVGVLPADFRFSPLSSLGTYADVYLPLTDTLARMRDNGHMFSVLTRVRRDVPMRAALDELVAVGNTSTRSSTESAASASSPSCSRSAWCAKCARRCASCSARYLR